MEFTLDLPTVRLTTLLANAQISTDKPNLRNHYDAQYHHVLLTVKSSHSFDLVSTDGMILTIQRLTSDIKNTPELPVGFNAMLPVRDIVAKIKSDKSSYMMTLDVSAESTALTTLSATYHFQNLTDEKFRDYTQLLGNLSALDQPSVALNSGLLEKLCSVKVPGLTAKEVIPPPLEIFIPVSNRAVRLRSHAQLEPGITWDWVGMIMPLRMNSDHIPFNGDLTDFC